VLSIVSVLMIPGKAIDDHIARRAGDDRSQPLLKPACAGKPADGGAASTAPVPA
jgi:hypothetical protein